MAPGLGETRGSPVTLVPGRPARKEPPGPAAIPAPPASRSASPPPAAAARPRRPAGFGFPHVFPIMWNGLKTAVAGPYLGVTTTVQGSLLFPLLQPSQRPSLCGDVPMLF